MYGISVREDRLPGDARHLGDLCRLKYGRGKPTPDLVILLLPAELAEPAAHANSADPSKVDERAWSDETTEATGSQLRTDASSERSAT